MCRVLYSVWQPSHPYMAYYEIQVFRFGTKDGKPADSLTKKHNYILQPVSGKAKHTKLRQNEFADGSQPQQKAVVNLDDVTLCLSKVQSNFSTSSCFVVPVLGVNSFGFNTFG